MPMPSYQSVLEKERERDVQNQPDASPATTAQRRFPSQSRQPNGVPYMMPRQPMGTMGPSMGWQRQIQEQSFFLEIMRMPPRILDQVKEDLGLAGKELTAMTFDEKWRLVLALRQRSAARQVVSLPSNLPLSNGTSAPPSAAPDISAALFTPDFIQSVANSLDEFEPTFLRPDGDINFERDFGHWFNRPDDVGASR